MATVETRKLDPARRAARLKKAVAAADPEEDQKELNRSGAIGALFNILGRTSGASAEAAFAATDNDPNTSVLGGIKEGLLGRADVSYRDVLKENLGVDNGPLAAIGGFAGDVALDPLTYFGAKKIKGISEPEAIVKALRSGSDDIAAETARIMAESPTRVGLTVAGKTFSTKAPKPLGITEKLLGPQTERKLLPRLFSADAELPLGLAESGRVIDNSNNASFVNFRSQMKTLFDGLDPEEQRLIAHARDTGESLDNVPVTNPNARFKVLGDYVKATQKLNDDFFLEEAKLGLFTKKKGHSGDLPTDYKEYNPNYVYRFYRNPSEKALRDGMVELPTGRIGGSEKAGFMKKRTADVTLAEARDKLGWDPVENIGEIMEMRAGKHFRSMAAGSQVRDAIEQFGITRDEYAKLGKGVEGNSGQIKDLKWVPATTIEGPVASTFGDRMVPEFVQRAMNQAWSTYKDAATGAEAMKLHDKIMRNWKFGNTAIMPSYHIRNSFGDFMLNLADGVKNPTRYSQAARVLRDRDAINARTLNSTLGGVEEAAGELGEGFIRVGNKKITTDQAWDLYGKSGAKSGLITSEIQKSMTDFERVALNNFASKGKKWVGDNIAEPREDFFRLAHFIDSLGKEMKVKGTTLDEAALRAGSRVRKFNIDYGKLSQFEKKFMSRIVPFYTWMRKSTPLNMEMLFTKPGFMALYPKGQDLFQGLLGTDDAEGELLIPEWIRESAPVRLAVGKQENRNLFQKLVAGVTGLGEGEPGFLNLAGETGGLAPLGNVAAPVGIAQGLASGNGGQAIAAAVNPLQAGFTPLIKAPIELGTGRSLFTGQPINYTSYGLQQLGGPGRVADPGNATSLPQSLFSALSGINVAGASAGRQEGEFMRRENLRAKQVKGNKEAALRKRFGAQWDSFSEAKQERLRQGLQLKKTAEDKTATRQRRYLTQILGQ